jgi:biopolymer transport protein ExbD
MKRSKIRRQKARAGDDAEGLNLVAMIDMFTVLVFFLLVTSTQILFVDTRALGLSLPGAPTAAAEAPPRQDIEIVVRAASIDIGDSAGGLIESVPVADLARMQAVLVELKRRAPEVRKVSVLAEEDISYQTLVSVLDRIRSYPAPSAGQARGGAGTQAELFPEIALGDAPALQERRT